MLLSALALALAAQGSTSPGADPPPPRAVEVSFEVAERLGYRRYRISGIEVELGIGLGDEARWGFRERPALATLESGEDGVVRATLDVPASWRKSADLRFFARVVEPGWERVSTSRGVQGQTSPLRLVARRGGTVHGKVLDAAGRPVEEAHVGIDYGREDGPHAPARTNAEGRFTLHWTPTMAADEVRIVARKAGLGAGESPSFRLAPELWRRTLELPLEPGTTLAGRIVDARGRPVPGLAVTAHPSAGFPRGLFVYSGEGRGGLLVARAWTDARGDFELRGMARGSYELHATLTGATRFAKRIDADRLGTPLGTLEAPTSGPGLLVHDLPRLEVTVVDHEGRGVDLASAVAPRPGPGEPGLTVMRLPSLDAQLPVSPDRVAGAAAGSRATFPCEPGASYLVCWTHPDVALRELRVQASYDSLTAVRIELEHPAPSVLSVRPLGTDGGPVGARVALDIHSADSGRRLASTHGDLPDVVSILSPRRERVTFDAELPAGRYRVRVWTPTDSCFVTIPRRRTPLRPAEAVIDLAPGASLDVALRLGAAGHLDLEAADPRPPLSPAERDALVPDHFIDEQVVEAARSRHGGAFVALVDSDGIRVPVEDFDLGGGFEELCVGWRPAFAIPGHPARGLAPLPPGEWTLRIERPALDGGEPDLLLERPVTIRAGEVTTVRW